MPIELAKSPVPRDALIIPDEHYFPEDNFRRCEWLGEFIMERQPEVIVRLGDCWDMPSLCSYDKGKSSFVFKNTKDDVESGHFAESLIFGPMLKYNKVKSLGKHKQYNPIIVKLLGNHEDRVARLLSYEPRWEGSVSMNDFKTRLPINEIIVDFQDFIIIDDVAYSHYFASGVQGRPFSSARAMLTKKGMSCTVGHTHIREEASMTKPTGVQCRALIAGTFQDADHKGFGGVQVDALYWSGLIYKHEVFNGDYSLEEIPIKRLERMFKTDTLTSVLS